MPFLGMARGTLSGGIWRNKTQEVPREDTALLDPMHVVSVIDADVSIATLILFTSMWFVNDISLCFSLDYATHNYKLDEERFTITIQSPQNMSGPEATFQRGGRNFVSLDRKRRHKDTQNPVWPIGLEAVTSPISLPAGQGAFAWRLGKCSNSCASTRGWPSLVPPSG